MPVHVLLSAAKNNERVEEEMKTRNGTLWSAAQLCVILIMMITITIDQVVVGPTKGDNGVEGEIEYKRKK